MKWYNQPITVKRALFAVMIANVNTLVVYKMWQSDVRKATQMRDDFMQFRSILLEVNDELLDSADAETLRRVNERMNYWRVVQGMPTIDV